MTDLPSNLLVVHFPNELDQETKAKLKEISKKSALEPKVFVCQSPSFELLKEMAQVQNLIRILKPDEVAEIEKLKIKTESSKNKNRDRVNKRIGTLNRQVESLHQALLAVHTANSTGEVERLLLQALKDTLDLDWCRIFFRYHEHMESQLDRFGNSSLFKAGLSIGQTQFGKIIFARDKSQPFSKSENELLLQVADGVSLAIDRLTKLDQAENLKQQWESTFDAISEPLCTTDKNFRIIRTNSAFSKVSGKPFKNLIGSNCFKSFLDDEQTSFGLVQKILKNQDEPGARTFKVQKKGSSTGKDQPENSLRVYEILPQRIKQDETFMILFRDITEQQKIEKQIFESAKMAELGTIGSSIAHELNNPLGGMISFLQLLKMDLKPHDAIYADIVEMEKAGQRCKEIVENLLGFTRQQDPHAATEVDLRDVVRQALKITELQARSLGVTVEMKWPEHPVKILGHFNLLAQAISHFLQNSFEAVSEHLTENPRYKGHIKIELRGEKSQIFLNISDNGVGISPENQNKIFNPLFSTKSRRRNQGLGLTLAYKIIDDHNGSIEIYSQPKMGTQVKIALTSV